jgi:hypothetical protein
LIGLAFLITSPIYLPPKAIITDNAVERTIIDHTDPAYTAGLQFVTTKTPWIIKIIQDDDTAAVYYPETHSIYFIKNWSTMNWYHELGHNVWHTQLTEAQQLRWINITRHGCAPTHYALTSYKEDFAETFSIVIGHSPYFMDQQWLNTTCAQERIWFIEKNIPVRPRDF